MNDQKDLMYTIQNVLSNSPSEKTREGWMFPERRRRMESMHGDRCWPQNIQDSSTPISGHLHSLHICHLLFSSPINPFTLNSAFSTDIHKTSVYGFSQGFPIFIFASGNPQTKPFKGGGGGSVLCFLPFFSPWRAL